ncbi:Uncharacterised protein [Chlamydia trachomatis]|nr:Uncharacterised protein [Chlamydia trachomatis]
MSLIKVKGCVSIGAISTKYFWMLTPRAQDFNGWPKTILSSCNKANKSANEAFSSLSKMSSGIFPIRELLAMRFPGKTRNL